MENQATLSKMGAREDATPHSREAIAQAFQGLDQTFVEKVTATNCARLYGFAP